MESTVKAEAERRRNAHGIERCPYSLAKDPKRLKSRFDELKERYPEQVKLIAAEESVMHENMILMHSFFPLLDNFLQEKAASISSIVGQLKVRVTEDQLAYGLRIMTARAIFAQTTKWAKEKVESLPEVSENADVQNFIDGLETYLSEHEIVDPLWWRKAFNVLHQMYLEEDPETYGSAEFMDEAFWRLLHLAYKADIDCGVLTDGDFANYNTLEAKFDLLNVDKGVACDTKFLKLLDVATFSYLAVIGPVSGMVEALAAEPQFAALSDEKKMKMIRSFKKELMAEATHSSRQFIDYSSRSSADSMTFFMPESFCYKPGTLKYDFKNLRVFIGTENASTQPLEPDEFPIQRGCPVVWVKGKDLGGNFLARQIDFMTDVFAEHYLGLKECEPLQTVWCVNEMSPIDAEIYDMLIALNALPFFASPSSCSGHLMTTSFFDNAPEGKYFCQDGYLGFEINRSDESLAFLEEVKALIQRYGNQLNLELEVEDERHYYIRFKYDGELSETQPTMKAAKRLYEIDREAGERKFAAFQAFWADMTELAYRYRPRDEEEEARFKATLAEQMEGIRPRPGIDDRFHMARI